MLRVKFLHPVAKEGGGVFTPISKVVCMAGDNMTKNQHYVPQFYLRRFSEFERKKQINVGSSGFSVGNPCQELAG